MSPDRPRRSWPRRVVRAVLLVLAVLVALLVARGLYAFRDRHPGYTVKLDLDGAKAAIEPRPLRVGFGRAKINPDLSDPTRPVWLAGFSQHRAATAIHDDLWAVGCVLDDGHARLGIVALDAIGFFHDDVIRLRGRLAADLKLDYTIVCATHNHSTPDLMGLWGPDLFHTGVDPRYQEEVILAGVRVLSEAVAALQPARVSFREIAVPSAGLVADTRKPDVFDPNVRLVHFTHPITRATLGTIIGWADHPETVWGDNTEVTADFCGYLRDALERGVVVDGQPVAAGVGGTHLYVNGAIGGLLSTTPKVTVRDPYLNRDFEKPSHDKARAVGRQLASRILPQLQATDLQAASQPTLTIRARTIDLPVDNPGFLLAPLLGLLDRGHVKWKTLRTEVALVTFGDCSIACVPGEIYPELVNGGIERPPGGDFDLDPVEVPPIRAMMPGQIKFLFGLANDEIGYIIPKSEWDRKPPFLYGAARGVYGEVNSVGPDTARVIHAALRELCVPGAR